MILNFVYEAHWAWKAPPSSFPLIMCLATQSCPTLCNPTDCNLPASSVRWDSQGKNTGVGCHALLQGIFPTQGLNPGLLHCRWIVYCLSHQGSLCQDFSLLLLFVWCLLWGQWLERIDVFFSFSTNGERFLCIVLCVWSGFGVSVGVFAIYLILLARWCFASLCLFQTWTCTHIFMRKSWDFSGSLVFKTSPSNAGGVGSILGWGVKIAHVLRPKTKT